MKSSKHVETCFVRAYNDFYDKLTAFWMKKKMDKNPKKRTLWCAASTKRFLVCQAPTCFVTGVIQ